MTPTRLAAAALGTGALLLAGLFWLGISGSVYPTEGHSDTGPAPPPGIAVVELFTSEGCSSCPPADRLLRSLVEDARAEDRPVYGLSFHVDYWNQLGWKDPYSKAAYSQRQRRYAEALGVDLYTPQMIVNGQRAFVGSRAPLLRESLKSALSTPASVHIDLHPTQKDDGIEVQYELRGDVPERATLQLALVERGLSQTVPRGENAGRTLRHTNVVRSFTTIPATQNEEARLARPEGVDRSSAALIGYVQSSSLAVLGATRVDLPDETPSSTP